MADIGIHPYNVPRAEVIHYTQDQDFYTVKFRTVQDTVTFFLTTHHDLATFYWYIKEAFGHLALCLDCVRFKATVIGIPEGETYTLTSVENCQYAGCLGQEKKEEVDAAAEAECASEDCPSFHNPAPSSGNTSRVRTA